MGGMLLGVNGGGGVSEGNMSGSSHESEMIILPYKRFVMIETEVIRSSHYLYLIIFRCFYNRQTAMTVGSWGKASKGIQGTEKL